MRRAQDTFVGTLYDQKFMVDYSQRPFYNNQDAVYQEGIIKIKFKVDKIDFGDPFKYQERNIYSAEANREKILQLYIMHE